MKLYFFRHAEAEPAAASDFDRNLTAHGRQRTETAARVLSRLEIAPEHIYSSPRVRARQTAEILAEKLGGKVEIEEGLDVDFDLEVVERLTAGLRDNDSILLVGHEPTMSQTLTDLTGARLEMKKGGMARVDVGAYSSPLQGRLVWLIAPKVFDALGGEA